ncbi:carbonic anhydrase [Gordonia sp. DT218]|uniref:carbonic anhydrase n=1 Tax=Gordonia sp. DT218 TaxID=3416659 RepID=UPI003CF60C71
MDSPSHAWRDLRDGNRRFVEDTPRHPNQDADTRHRLTRSQHPKAVIFGCSDSRVAAEIVFDQGLGDLFVVRNAGHLVDSSVLGSIEFALDILEVPLVVVLGHDSCGAVGATVNALDTLALPSGHIRDLVERVTPSILAGREAGLETVNEFVSAHVQQTSAMLIERSKSIASKTRSGEAAIVGLTYHLTDGAVDVVSAHGEIDQLPCHG